MAVEFGAVADESAAVEFVWKYSIPLTAATCALVAFSCEPSLRPVLFKRAMVAASVSCTPSAILTIWLCCAELPTDTVFAWFATEFAPGATVLAAVALAPFPTAIAVSRPFSFPPFAV
ncbi:hypothetical protein AWB79_07188 [Caballeronia hypogeia]|uniref:Uncharacterized protein n=1 Tax=Caballeronia hypogeia TaxID=1777140 RepID=A0A158DKH1_9BURK|nr:hypothetical protein AWB79_07188 [Caballeronia hypogeia]